MILRCEYCKGSSGSIYPWSDSCMSVLVNSDDSSGVGSGWYNVGFRRKGSSEFRLGLCFLSILPGTFLSLEEGYSSVGTLHFDKSLDHSLDVQ